MSVIQVKAQISKKQLLHAVASLTDAEFQRFIKQASALRAKQPKRLSRRESELLMKINEGPPAKVRQRYDELFAKKRESELAPSEYEELCALSDQLELDNAQRLENLAQLAQVRGQSLEEVMHALGIDWCRKVVSGDETTI